ncbi:DUF6414 family protein [Nocardia beijingensis]
MTTPERRPAPTIVIYQNSDFVSGMLQELSKTGLLESAEQHTKLATSDRSSSSTETGVQPTPAEISATGPSFVREQAEVDEKATADRKKFVYSQSFYLDAVRFELRKLDLVRSVGSLTDLAGAKIGDVIEFAAPFMANEVNAILDIATPQFTSAIASYWIKRKGLKEIYELGEHAGIEEFARRRELSLADASDRAALTESVTAALRADFRGEHTKEFYGILDDLTAVTVCEAEHFITRDPDRILDGTFTVLAKLVSAVENDTPVLSRNKLLNRLDVDFLNQIFADFSDAGTKNIPEKYSAERILDTNFSATIEGPSITVLPIAIYV